MLVAKRAKNVVISAVRRYHGVLNASSSQMDSYLRVDMVPLFEDNYSYIVTDQVAQVSVFIDPADPEAVLSAWRSLADAELAHEPVAILTTHHHADHSGGNLHIKQEFPDIEVYGPLAEPIPARTQGVKDLDKLQFGGLEVEVIGTPGHTKDHVSYFVEAHGQATMPAARVVCSDMEVSQSAGFDPIPSKTAGALFSGDTLFVSGCGRLFEGLPEHMHASLSRLTVLPPSTRVFCGHEYTLDNLAFTATVDPMNKLVHQKMDLCLKLRKRGLPTVPSTIEDELALNPFIRTSDEGIRAVLSSAIKEDFTSTNDSVRVLAGLREWKNRFKAV